MPGLVGCVTRRPGEWAEARLLRMVESLRHEPFYVTGTWSDESLGVYVGWVSRRNSFDDRLPLRNDRGDVVLLFSGEEYPDPGTVGCVTKDGRAVGAGDAACLVHRYEGRSSYFAGLNGRFHGVLADRNRGVATLFNDRYGMHRLFFHESKDAFYFGSEAKAILAVCPELRRANPRSLGEHISFGCILQDRTLFDGIYALPGGSAWQIRRGSIEEKGSYFHPREWEGQEPLAPEAYYREIQRILAANLPRYFKGEEQLGIALTGGLDTRVILSLRNPVPNSLPCYTFGGEFRESHDVRIARQVAKVCEQPYSVIAAGGEMLSRFADYAERSIYRTEGSVDVSRAPDLYFSERAREIAPAKVVGTYGSEILQRAVMFKPKAPVPGVFRAECLRFVQEAERTYSALRREHPVTFAAFMQSPWYHHGVLSLEESQLSVRCPYLDNDFVRSVFRAPSTAADDVRLRLVRDGSDALGLIPTDRGLGGSAGRVAESCRRLLREFTFKAEYAYDYGMPQWVSRIDHAFSRLHLERLFLGRHKMLHFRVWYRDSLSEYVRQMLLDSRTLSRPYLEPKGVQNLVHGHLKAGRNYTIEIHRLLTVELLHRVFLDG